jgi:hypothetical protein
MAGQRGDGQRGSGHRQPADLDGCSGPQLRFDDLVAGAYPIASAG